MIKTTYQEPQENNYKEYPKILTYNENTLEINDIPLKQELDGDNLVLKGESDKYYVTGENQQRKLGSKFIIGYYEKNNPKKLQLLETGGIYKIEAIQKQELQNIESNINNEQLPYLRQKQNFVQQFGTQKAKRKVAQTLSNLVEDDNILHMNDIENYIEDKVQEIRLKTNQENQNKQQAEQQLKEQFLPKINWQASNVYQIYQLNSIISDNELEHINVDYLLQQINQKQSIKMEDLQQFHKFVGNLINQFNKHFSNRKNKKLLLKQLYYLSMMMKLVPWKQFQFQPEQLANKLKVDNIFINHLIEKFYQISSKNDQNLYIRPQLYQDKLICYILVLTLIIFDFTYDVYALSKELSVDISKISEYGKEIGCKVQIKPDLDNHQVIFKLQFPLKQQSKSLKYKKK